MDVFGGFKRETIVIERVNERLEANRSGTLDETSRHELDQFEMAESLMRLEKARIRAGQAAP